MPQRQIINPTLLIQYAPGPLIAQLRNNSVAFEHLEMRLDSYVVLAEDTRDLLKQSGKPFNLPALVNMVGRAIELTDEEVWFLPLERLSDIPSICLAFAWYTLQYVQLQID